MSGLAMAPNSHGAALPQAAPSPPGVSLRRILRLMGPYRRRLSLVLLLIAGASASSLLPPFIVRELLDVALPQGRTGLLAVLCGAMMTMTVLSTTLGVVQGYLTLTVGQRMTNDLRVQVYAHLQRMSFAFFTKSRNGELQSRIANDIGGVSATLIAVATSVVGSVTTIGTSLAAMFALNWQLTVVSLLTLPVFAWISRQVGAERRELTRRRQEQMAVMASLVEESLSVGGFLLGRTMGRTRTLVEEFSDRSAELTELTIRSAVAGRWRQATISIITAAMPISIYYAAGLTAHGVHAHISVGTLVAFTGLQQGLFSPTTALLQTGIAVQSSLALFERVFEYLDLPVEVEEPIRPVPLPASRVPGHVRYEHVGFDHGDIQILRDITLDLPPGSHTAIVGPTGAGKTTLAHLLPRLYDVSSGRITIDGVDVRDLSLATISENVGVVSQDTHLFHTTIADNLRFAKAGATEAELAAAAEAAQIHELIQRLPDGYETIVGERGYRFSGGEKQRLAIARTVLRDPPILVLDEATSALDTQTERSVQQALDALRRGRTTITIAHRLSTVRQADQIIVLDNGTIIERGTHEQLITTSGRYHALVTAHMAKRP